MGVGRGGHEGVDAGLRGELAGPVHRDEDRARLDAVGDEGADEGAAVGARDLDEVGGGDAADLGVGRMDLGEGLGDVLAETRGAAGPGHRVPLVADASGVEGEGIFGARSAMAGWVTAIIRPLPSAVRKRPSAKKRAGPPTGHCAGGMAS